MPSTDAREAFDRFARNPVVVTIDLHRGHLDPAVATLPIPPDRAAALVERSEAFLTGVRERGVPIIHVVTAYRDREEIVANPFWAFQADRTGSTRARIAEHQLEDGPGVAMMPTLVGDGDVIIATKKRYDCFVGTELELLLRAGGHETLIVLGVNTNSCVLATSVAASVRDFAVFVLDEGIDSMMGLELDAAGRAVLDASFGWVMGADEALAGLDRLAAAAAG